MLSGALLDVLLGDSVVVVAEPSFPAVELAGKVVLVAAAECILASTDVKAVKEVEDDGEVVEAVGVKSAVVDMVLNGTVTVLLAASVFFIQNW